MKKIERRLEALEDEAKPPAGFKVRSWDEFEAWCEAGADLERLDLSEAGEPFLRELAAKLEARLEDAQGEAEP